MSVTEFLERLDELFGEEAPERLEYWDAERGAWVPSDEW